MKRFITTFYAIIIVLVSTSQEKMDYFLPKDVKYNIDIPTPEHFFQQAIGEWHLNHDQVMYYMKQIASLSDRAIIKEYARSYENRPLVHLIFTSEKNHKNLDELKALHYNFSEPDSEISEKGVPVVVSLTYGVHGNESSATNSAVLSAYYLAAAEGEKIDELLDNTIIIIDPCLNPDGFVRHSTWANMHQSSVANGNPDSRQYREVWPGGRSNHYWFDLNRDYLLLVNPESQGRVDQFHQWKPNIVTDHHEMGSNSTFFFQPGVPSRNNPLTPKRNYELTHEIAKYHAQFLDKNGEYFFSEEQFDDYYFGKGSSYPDLNASIGILFEQAGYRGRVRQTSNGLKTLASGIKNQFTVSLSTLEASMNLRSELLNLQRDFYRDALELADKNETKAYIFGSDTDKVKTQKFVDFLNKHQIKVYGNKKQFTANGLTFTPENSFIVPAKQKQFRLIKSIFEEVTSFSDTTFYDVSTWTFTHAFGINYAKTDNLKAVELSDLPVNAKPVEGKIIGGKSSLGYLFEWNEFTAAKALYAFQHAGLMTKVATNKFMFEFDGKKTNFTYGTIFIPVSNQPLNETEIYQLAQLIAKESGIDVYGLSTGLSPKGIDLGSGSFASLKKPEILLFIGGSTSSRDAGEIWHLFDQRYQIPITLAESNSLRSINLNDYNTLILPGGSYREWSSSEVQKLKSWAANGGNVIAYKSSTSWAAKNGFGKTQFKTSVQADTAKYLSYAERNKERSLNYISGAIFYTNIDLSHPLCYGYTQNNLAIFKSGTSVPEPLGTKFSEPVKYSTSPYLSGWVSEKNIERIKDAPVVSVQSLGRGKLISYHDNMNFRGIWLGTSKLFSNSVFFGSVIR